MKKNTLKVGFTLAEIMIVVIILGVIASLAIVQYRKMLEESYCNNSVLNLGRIYFAAQSYEAKGGSIGATWASMGSLSAINSNLGISIAPDPRFNYAFTNSSLIRATRTAGPAYYCEVKSNMPLGSPGSYSPGCSSVPPRYCSGPLSP